MSSRSKWIGLVTLLCTASAVFGQSSTGSITGLVADASGAVVVGAKVTAKNLNTGEISESLSSGTGNYVLVGLRVGSYEISSSVAGFKGWSRGPVPLSSNDNGLWCKILVDTCLISFQPAGRVSIPTPITRPTRLARSPASSPLPHQVCQI